MGELIGRVIVVVVDGKITVYADKEVDVFVVRDTEERFDEEFEGIEMDTSLMVVGGDR